MLTGRARERWRATDQCTFQEPGAFPIPIARTARQAAADAVAA